MGKKQISLEVSCDSFAVERDGSNDGIMLISLADVDAYFLASQLSNHQDLYWLLDGIGINRVIEWVKDNGYAVAADE